MRDNFKKFEDKGCSILGISMDGAETHRKFCGDLELKFDLLADVEKKAHEAYGFKGYSRALFLVDKKGVVKYANRKFDLKKESWEELFKALEALE